MDEITLVAFARIFLDQHFWKNIQSRLSYNLCSIKKITKFVHTNMPRGKVLTSAGHHSFFLKSAHTRAESDILAQSGFKQSDFPIPVSCCSSIFEESLDFCEILCSEGFGFFNPSSFSKSASLLSVTFLFLFETGSSSGVSEKCQIKHQTWIKLADNCVLPCEWL